MHVDETYKTLVRDVLENGQFKSDRTGTGTRSVFGRQFRYDLREGFPILTTKKVHWKSVVGELLWFLRGDTNIKFLNDNGISIWNEWADSNGDLGPVYSKQWRSWETTSSTSVDQIGEVIQQIQTNPDSRRLVVSAWNVSDLPRMALVPCHTTFQFYVASGTLSCQLYQRSCDCGLGQPFNVASYALLTRMIAQVCGLGVGEFIHTLGDAHVYCGHEDKLREQITRMSFPMPTLWLNPQVHNIDDFTFDDIKLENYQHHPAISLKVAV